MTHRLAYNPTDAPVTLAGGVTVGGRERAMVDDTDRRVQSAIATNRLALIAGEPEAQTIAEILDAVERSGDRRAAAAVALGTEQARPRKRQRSTLVDALVRIIDEPDPAADGAQLSSETTDNAGEPGTDTPEA